ncbi:MAG: DNA polymerase III subunit delta [Chloroflexota bacterium]|nr:DNA polymerase III subunit delta [Chloroflexota bacterium]
MFHILYGVDGFSLKEELQGIKSELGDAEALLSNTSTFEGQRARMNQVMDACMAVPFLGSHRLVVVEGLLGCFEKRERDPGNEPPALKEWVGLKDRVAGMPPTTVLVLIDGEVSKQNPLLRKLSPVASVKEFRPRRGQALHDWIQGRVRGRGGDMAPSAAKLLASLVGESLWALSNEIDKLVLYASGRRIEEDDVKAVVSHAREANVFAMVDAIVERRASVAATLLHQLLWEGASPPYLITMITRQLRMLVVARELTQMRLPAAEIKSQLALASGSTSDYALSKALEQSRRYSMGRLEQVYRRILEADLSIKTGALSGELALDCLVADLCV